MGGHMTTDSERILVIIPTYNEADNLPRIVPAVLEIGRIEPDQ